MLSAVSLLAVSAISVDTRTTCSDFKVQVQMISNFKAAQSNCYLLLDTSITFAFMSFWSIAIAKSYNYTIVLLCIFVLPCSYSRIYLTLRHHNTQIHQLQGQPESGEAPLNIARCRKTVATAIWVLVALLACYLPYSIVLVIFTTNGSSSLLDMIWELSAILVFKPILYRWRERHIKQQVKKTINYILCSSEEVTF